MSSRGYCNSIKARVRWVCLLKASERDYRKPGVDAIRVSASVKLDTPSIATTESVGVTLKSSFEPHKLSQNELNSSERDAIRERHELRDPLNPTRTVFI